MSTREPQDMCECGHPYIEHSSATGECIATCEKTCKRFVYDTRVALEKRRRLRLGT